MNLKAVAVNAVLWSALRVASSQLASFVVFITLARVLGPSDFGVYALALAVLDIARVLANAGLHEAIQREPELDAGLADTAFSVGLVLSVGLVPLTALLAIPYASIMHRAELVPLLAALSLTLPITALGNIHLARILRDFGHKYVAIRTMVASLVAGAAAVIAAFQGLGVWSFVIQVGLAEVIGTAVAWIALPWRPRVRLEFSQVKRLISFGGGMVTTQLLWVVLSRVPEFFIGRRLGADAVGVYRIAWRLFDLIGQSVLQPIGSVAMVTLSKLQGDPARFEKAYARIVGLGVVVGLPLIFGFGAVARDAVPFLFGEHWAESGPIASVAALAALPLTLSFFYPSALGAKGKSRAMAVIAFVQVIATCAAVWLSSPYGLLAVAMSVVVRHYATLPFIQYQLRHAAEIRIGEALRPVLAPLGSSLLMGGIILLNQSLWINGFDNRLARIGASVALGIVSYALALIVISPSSITSLTTGLRAPRNEGL